MATGTVLVTGAGGFVGRHVVAALRRRGRPVLALEHRWSGPDELAARLDGREVAACVHLGWHADPRNYLTSWEGNRRSLADSVDLVAQLGRAGCRHLVVAGTCAEYAPSDEALTENSPVGPRSVYGATKAALHLLLATALRPPTMAVAWARLFNVVGPGEHPDRVVPAAARALLAGRAIDLSPGAQVRDFLDVEDAAEALVALSAARAAGTFNVCSGEPVALLALLARLADHTGEPGRRELLRFGARPYGAAEAMVVLGANDRLRRATGWARRHGTDAVAARALAYWRGRAG